MYTILIVVIIKQVSLNSFSFLLVQRFQCRALELWQVLLILLHLTNRACRGFKKCYFQNFQQRPEDFWSGRIEFRFWFGCRELQVTTLILIMSKVSTAPTNHNIMVTTDLAGHWRYTGTHEHVNSIWGRDISFPQDFPWLLPLVTPGHSEIKEKPGEPLIKVGGHEWFGMKIKIPYISHMLICAHLSTLSHGNFKYKQQDTE